MNVGNIYYLVNFSPPVGIILLENKSFVVKDDKMSIAHFFPHIQTQQTTN